MDNRKWNLLIVEDETITREMLTDYFAREEFHAVGVRDGAMMNEHIREHEIDVVILDVMLPDVDGFTLTRELRRHNPQVIIILLTGKRDQVDRVVGLELGADDYVTKPFSERELLARVRAQLRRLEQLPGHSFPERFEFAGWTFDLQGHRLHSPVGEEIHLPNGEYYILRELVSQPGVVISREELLRALEREGYGTSSRSLDVQISRLRSKLNDTGTRQLISTVHGSGYAFRGTLD